jgi:hypothetical protein
METVLSVCNHTNADKVSKNTFDADFLVATTDNNPIGFFCAYGPDDPLILQQLVDNGSSIYVLHKDRVSCMRIAYSNYKFRVIRKLLDLGADVNELRFALSNRSLNPKIAEILIDAGCIDLAGEQKWITKIRKRHTFVRSCAIYTIGLISRRRYAAANGRHLAKMIGRAIWELRGIRIKKRIIPPH